MIIVLAMLFVVILIACVAFAVDLGYLCLARSQAQNAADAAALAAANRLIDDRLILDDYWDALESDARDVAVNYAAKNTVAGSSPSLARNDANQLDGDLIIGTRTEGGSLTIPADMRDSDSVHVRIRCAADTHGPVSLFFARAMGIDSMEVAAEAIATFNGQIDGFRPNSKTGNCSVIPFVIHIDDWRDLQAGTVGSDGFAVDSETHDVWVGSDGIPEFSFYPNRTTAGNFGTVNIGNAANSTSELIDQIVNGVSEADAAMHGGKIGVGSYSGDPGISAGMKDGLAAILGQPRTVMLYDTVTGTGATTEYNVVGFAGVRIMSYWVTETTDEEVKKGFRVVLQPAAVVDDSAVSGPGQNAGVYQPTVLTK
jgi:hypothetical protein